MTKGSDLYSLGATAIALLTNTSSVKISELIDESYKLRFRHLISGISPKFIDWLQKMVAPNPKTRYPNAAEALQDLRMINISEQATVAESTSPNFKIIAAIASLVTLVSISLFSTLKSTNTSTSQAITKLAQLAKTLRLTTSQQNRNGLGELNLIATL